MDDSAILRSQFGKRIEALIFATGVSIDTFANQLAFPASRIGQIVNGMAPCVTLSEMSALADALDVPLPDLLSPRGPIGVMPFEEVEQG